ncbi:MBL fold metallo-hydrolase [Planctomycetota bacterium]
MLRMMVLCLSLSMTVWASTNTPAPYQFKVGKFQCTVIYDGHVQFSDPDMFFQGAPEDQYEEKLTSHKVGPQLKFSCQFLLVKTEAKLVLIDTGFGAIPENFPLTCQAGMLGAQLKELHVDPCDIDIVLLTHWHFDHVGGCVTLNDEMVFPNAKHYIVKADWELGISGDMLTKSRLLPLTENMEFIEGETEILPGIKTLPTPGHTPGLYTVLLSSEDDRLLYISDVLAHEIHLEKPNWFMGFEADPNLGIASRRQILEYAATSNITIHACHLDFPGLGHIVPQQNGWQWQPNMIESVNYTRQRDVIYGYKHGMALILDVFIPTKTNGIGVLWIVSGSGRSSRQKLEKDSHQKGIQALLARGYTVFGIMHSSAPRFTLPEFVPDIHRAVRFVRYHAKAYGIDPNHIGATGASAAGTLALLVGCADRQADPEAKDPVNSVSSGVQAVGCFFAPTDFLNFDSEGTDFITFQKEKYNAVDAAFQFHEYRKDKDQYVPVTDHKEKIAHLREFSPITHVNKNSAPTLMIHGDKDPFIPIQQAHRMIKRLKEAGVPSELKIKPGKGHGWPAWEQDVTTIADWFDTTLLR